MCQSDKINDYKTLNLALLIRIFLFIYLIKQNKSNMIETIISCSHNWNMLSEDAQMRDTKLLAVCTHSRTNTNMQQDKYYGH